MRQIPPRIAVANSLSFSGRLKGMRCGDNIRFCFAVGSGKEDCRHHAPADQHGAKSPKRRAGQMGAVRRAFYTRISSLRLP
jgi:hypothetical protein